MKVVIETEQKWQQELKKLLREEKEKMRVLKKELMEQSTKNLEEIIDAWHAADQRSMEERLRFEAEITARYEKTLETYKTTMDRLVEEKVRARPKSVVACGIKGVCVCAC